MGDVGEWPEWWTWEIELSAHVLKRMVDREFTETDLRTMMEDADGHKEDVEPGRWVIETHHAGRQWEIVVEPIATEQVLLVVTAYRVN